MGIGDPKLGDWMAKYALEQEGRVTANPLPENGEGVVESTPTPAESGAPEEASKEENGQDGQNQEVEPVVPKRLITPEEAKAIFAEARQVQAARYKQELIDEAQKALEEARRRHGLDVA